MTVGVLVSRDDDRAGVGDGTGACIGAWERPGATGGIGDAPVVGEGVDREEDID